MIPRKPSNPRLIGCLISLSLLALPAQAESVEKKFRFSFSGGIFNATDSIQSDAANVLVLRCPAQPVDPWCPPGSNLFELSRAFVDPRNDSSVFGSLDIQPSPLATVAAQYAVTDIFVVEASVGFQKGDVGDVDVQVEFAGAQRELEIPFAFTSFRIPAGELTRVPIQVTALARFRPRATFNPYFGLGAGYSLIGFEPTAEFNALSVALDSARGGQTRLTQALGTVTDQLVPPPPDEFFDLEGARVDAPDTFEFHGVAGAELSVRRNWVLFVDVRYTIASRDLFVGFNGGEDLGIGVPRFVDFEGSPISFQNFGAIEIRDGGLVDGGMLVLQPVPTAPPGTDCNSTPQFCRTVFDPTQPDGLLDPGVYYIQGGSVEYNGLAMQFGFRVTF